MKKIFFITIILIQISFLNTPYSLAQNFAPLNLGNVWVWENDSNIRFKTKVIDTSYFINNNLYAKIQYTESLDDYYIYARYNNKDSMFLRYEINYPYNNGEIPYYKLYCNVGDTFLYQINQYANTIISVNETYQAPVFDTMLTVKILHFNHGGLVETYQAWTDEIGLLGIIDIPWNNTLFTLKGCIVNDRIYGDTSYTVGIEDDPFITHNFKLFQNYPNPFNPTTTIKYELQEYALVNLKVYDVLGNEVAILVNEEKYAGKYQINFNGKGLSSGVYFYKLTIGGNTQVRKMILLR